MGDQLTAFTSGLIVAGFLLSALFFLRFWSRLRDRLFAYFSIAFALLGLNEAFVTVSKLPREDEWHYAMRLAAFCLIILAIVMKNVPAITPGVAPRK